MSIWVCGEVLIDILQTGPVVGGGPANTAKALARLGYEVDFIDGISSDAYGVSARKELERDGVGLGLALSSDKPTCTATVTLDAAGSASYEFLSPFAALRSTMLSPSQSECEWKSRIMDGAGRGGGIRSCDRNKTVVEISLYNELTGTIPTEIGQLRNLRTL